MHRIFAVYVSVEIQVIIGVELAARICVEEFLDARNIGTQFLARILVKTDAWRTDRPHSGNFCPRRSCKTRRVSDTIGRRKGNAARYGRLHKSVGQFLSASVLHMRKIKYQRLVALVFREWRHDLMACLHASFLLRHEKHCQTYRDSLQKDGDMD